MRNVFVILFVLLVSVAAQAAILHVGTGQTYTTIQGAVNAAGTGDEVIIHAGVYTETVSLVDKNNMIIRANIGDKAVVRGTFSFWNPSSATWSDNNLIKGLYFDRTGFTGGWATTHQYSRNNTYENVVFYGDNSGSGGIYGYCEYGLNTARNSTFYRVMYPSEGGYASGLHVFDSIVAFSGGSAGSNSNGATVQYSDYYMNPAGSEMPSNISNTTGNINLDPLFYSTNPASPYFLWLSLSSPANNADGQGTNMGALPTIPEPVTIMLLGLGALALRKRS